MNTVIKKLVESACAIAICSLSIVAVWAECADEKAATADISCSSSPCTFTGYNMLGACTGAEGSNCVVEQDGADYRYILMVGGDCIDGECQNAEESEYGWQNGTGGSIYKTEACDES